MRHPTHVQFPENDPIPSHRGKKFPITKVMYENDDEAHYWVDGANVWIRSHPKSQYNNWIFFFEPIPVSQFQELLTNIRSTLNVLCNESNDVQQDSGGVS